MISVTINYRILLRKYKTKLFGLTIDPERLQAIREMRRPDSRYASLKQCQYEVNEVEALYRRHAIPFLSTTERSVEEISARILQVTGKRRSVSCAKSAVKLVKRID